MPLPQIYYDYLTSNNPNNVQFAGLSIGRALSAGYLFDVYSAAEDENAAQLLETAAASKMAYQEYKSDGGYMSVGVCGTSAPGTFLGQNLADTGYIQTTNLTALLIGTLGTKSVYIGTNDIAAITISSAQVVTFAQNVTMTSGKVFAVDHIAEATGAHGIALDHAITCVSTVQTTGLGIGLAPVAGAIAMTEIAAPAAPAADNATIFVCDDGSGKTSLRVRFHNSTQIIATDE